MKDSAMTSPRPPLSSMGIVVPLFNEAEGIARFHAQLRQVVDKMQVSVRFVYVDDGSSDDTNATLERLRADDHRIEIVSLTRNFGHQAALTAGLDYIDADVVIMMDGDGQHPPALIPQMIEHYLSGCEIVLTQRVDDQDSGILKRLTSSGFYALINRIGQTRIEPGTADFRLLSRESLVALRSLPEYHRFIRGLVAWLGYPLIIITYSASPRIAGNTKYSVRKMLRLANDAISSFSLLPLKIGLAVGAVFIMLSVAEIMYVLSFWIQGTQSRLEPGWSSIMFVVLFVGGCIMGLLGIIGVYVGHVFQEVKRRPVYIVHRRASAGRASYPTAEHNP
jgi:glycosyltransferase involved in cell wall biosynthesis